MYARARTCALAVLVVVGLLDIALSEQVIQATRLPADVHRPVGVVVAPGDHNRLYVLEQQRRRIMVVDPNTGQIVGDPFLRLPAGSGRNEQGFLGLAFDPNYQQNGYFYVNYTDAEGTTNVVRYQVSDDPSVADPDSAFPILSIPQPQANHNAGWMDFGPRDNYLYIATGDGGGADDNGAGHTPGIGNAQDVTDNLLGKLLRIDVSNDAFPADATRNYAVPADNPFVGREGDDEIWSYGLRNPWRNSFDALTGDLYIGDVGQAQREEINFQPADSTGGENYGWRLREGTIQTPGVGGPPPADNVEPIYDYPHNSGPTGGFSVTGGYVYRGPIQELQGHYFFADYVTSQIWSFRYDGQDVSDFQRRTDSIITEIGPIPGVSSFGEDHEGNLYVVSLDGALFRFDGVAELSDLVPAGSVWRYLDDGSDQGVAWRQSQFDDSGWSEGPAQLGYGDGDEATVVGFGGDTSNRFVTTYFRHEFDVSDPENIDQLLLDVLRDDGAAVFLNGVEIFRTDNLAPDATFDDLANFGGASSIGGADEDTFVRSLLSTDLLVTGTNVLAVEMHQHSRTSSDLSFDLRLASLGAVDLEGDFNNNGILDVSDINDLTRQSASGINDSAYDLNTDNLVDSADIAIWIEDLFSSWSGDANLDGEFNSQDLVNVLAAGKYEVDVDSEWSSGDFNGDGRTTSSDLSTALADGGYNAGPRTAVSAVPEPSSTLGILFGLATLIVRRRSQ